VSPSAAAIGVTQAIAQQVLGESVLGTSLILLSCRSGTHQVAQRFVCRVRHPDGGQNPSAIKLSQLHRVATIGLDAFARLLGDERRRDHFALDAELGQLPVRRVPRGARFVADLERLEVAQLGDELAQCLRAVGERPKEPVVPYD
jgi:hypothetical protein